MSNADTALFDSSQIELIEWDMLDKRKYIPLSLCTNASVRALLYPLMLVKTRIQVRQRSAYRGTMHALWSIFCKEGIRGLYSGYLISNFQIFSGLVYTITYEGSRHYLFKKSVASHDALRSSLGGALASCTCLLLVVPSDIVSQHMMVFERRSTSPHVDALNLRQLVRRNANVPIVWLIMKEIRRRDGLRGFYRGYPASVLCYAPSSACMWALYIEFSRVFNKLSPSHLLAQALAAPCAGAVIAVLFNALDLFRANLQVQRTGWSETIHRLWIEERWRIFIKGLPTRLAIIPTSTLFMFASYECVKRFSVHSDLQEMVKW